MSWYIINRIRDGQKVPTADASTNVYVNDVVGNKTDAATATVGTTATAVAYIKGLLGLHPVPTADATTNTNVRDVVGNKTDAGVTTSGTTKSVIAYLKGLLLQSYGTANGTIVEDLSAGTSDVLQVEPGISSALGAWFQKDASASADSWISHIFVTLDTAFSGASTDYVIEVGTGGAGSEATKARFSFRAYYATATGERMPIVIPFPHPIKVTSGTRIAVRAAKSAAGTGTYIYVGLSMYQGLAT